jgi:hypothetical protein
MLDHTQAPAAFQPRLVSRLSRRANPDDQTVSDELLPFTVRLVGDDEDLGKAVQIRHQAYARHLPEFAQTLKNPEAADAESGVVVLLAESKLDGSPLGTMRIQTNQFKPLCLEQSVVLPEWLRRRRLAEATRLAVTNESVGRMVKTVLFKAYFQYCLQTGIEWMVIAGRSPIDRQYERLMFEDVFPGMGYIPLLHASNLPHRVMSFNIDTAEQRWSQAKHPLLGFMCHTRHPDIELGNTRHWAQTPASLAHTFAAHGANLPM